MSEILIDGNWFYSYESKRGNKGFSDAWTIVGILPLNWNTFLALLRNIRLYNKRELYIKSYTLESAIKLSKIVNDHFIFDQCYFISDNMKYIILIGGYEDE